MGYGLEEDWDVSEEFDYEKETYYNRIAEMESRYKDNKLSQDGTTIRCACCGRRILKAHYQTQFCTNKGAGNCKDKYWNNVSGKRRTRAQSVALSRRR